MEEKVIQTKIGEEEARKALAILEKYKQGKKSLDERLIDNEQWWKMRHWDRFKKKNKNGNAIEPASAWLINSLINKHADFMDNYPEANILPREESDKETAKILSDVIPFIMDRNEYTAVYSEATWQKIKMGTSIYGVFWDAHKENGLGDISIKKCDPLKMYWEPGIDKIQESRNLFYLNVMDNDLIEQEYPQMQGKLNDTLISVQEYLNDDYVDTTGKSLIIDWYYKKTFSGMSGDVPVMKTVLHYCKICNGTVLYASENDPKMADGWYKHGQYPFVFDLMFPIEHSPFGFGYLDIMKDCQEYIDKLSQSILQNSIAGSRPRYACKDSSGFNEEEFSDLSRDIVHYNGSKDDMLPLKVAPLPGIYYQVYQGKIEELKETSGNRDFSQGATASGVTAASAIAALQEAGSKLSRDMINGSYQAFQSVVNIVLELIRQFYTAPRVFRIANDTGENFVSFDNSGMQAQEMEVGFTGMIAERKPVYDIKVQAQKASPFTKISQNELAKEMYDLGFFNPQLADQALACLEMMMFDGKEEVMQKIAQNGTLYQQMQQMQQTMSQMAAVIAQSTGDTRLLDAVGAMGPGEQPIVSGGSSKSAQLDAMGNATREAVSSTAGKARERAAKAATPKGAE